MLGILYFYLLKDRKNEKLSFDEIEHYQKMINVLHLTIEIQKHIDQSDAAYTVCYML